MRMKWIQLEGWGWDSVQNDILFLRAFVCSRLQVQSQYYIVDLLIIPHYTRTRNIKVMPNKNEASKETNNSYRNPLKRVRSDNQKRRITKKLHT